MLYNITLPRIQTMTGGDNARLHGICIIIWIPLNPKAAEDLERRCEEWRRDNMTDEERELATSLGERYICNSFFASYNCGHY